MDIAAVLFTAGPGIFTAAPIGGNPPEEGLFAALDDQAEPDQGCVILPGNTYDGFGSKDGRISGMLLDVLI